MWPIFIQLKHNSYLSDHSSALCVYFFKIFHKALSKTIVFTNFQFSLSHCFSNHSLVSILPLHNHNLFPLQHSLIQHHVPTLLLQACVATLPLFGHVATHLLQGHVAAPLLQDQVEAHLLLGPCGEVQGIYIHWTPFRCLDMQTLFHCLIHNFVHYNIFNLVQPCWKNYRRTCQKEICGLTKSL